MAQTSIGTRSGHRPGDPFKREGHACLDVAGRSAQQASVDTRAAKHSGKTALNQAAAHATAPRADQALAAARWGILCSALGSRSSKHVPMRSRPAKAVSRA